MKAIFALFFATVLGAACSGSTADASTVLITGTNACDCEGTTECGGANDAADQRCKKGSGNAAKCGTLDEIKAIAKCKSTDGTTEEAAICVCGDAIADEAGAKKAIVCDVKQMCTVDASDATKNKCTAAGESSATMIGAFITVMATAFFSF